MMKWMKSRRILAAVLAAGLVLGTQGMTAVTAYAGPGAARPVQGGPGAAAEQGQTGSQGESDPAAGQGTSGTSDAASDQAAGQEASGQTGSQDAPDIPADQTAQKPSADGPSDLRVGYSAMIAGQGWSSSAEDNRLCTAPAGAWVTAIKANLITIPEGLQVGLRYQVNLSGSGWLNWAEDGKETGDSSGATHLESLKMELTGAGASQYDIYYKVYQNGAWTQWAMNGAPAGTEGAGLRIDGIRASITFKGAPAPSENPLGGAVDPSRPMIALTFDDGPRASVTNRILDSLAANGGRATFFMVGTSINGNAAVIQRMVSQGCEVGNHTNDHKYLSKLGAEGITSQLGAVNQKVAAACGVSPVLMRPPGGYINDNTLAVLKNLGMPAIMWSIDTRDWQHRNPQKTIETVLTQVKDGDIILMHDLYETTAQAAEVLIPELTARGYQLVTVSELASYRGGMQPGHKYSQFRP